MEEKRTNKMATLTKRPDSPYWWIFYRQGGLPVRESTKVRHKGRKKPDPNGQETRILRAVEERISCDKFGVSRRQKDASISEWFVEFWSWYTTTRKLAPSTVYGLKYLVRVFLDWCDAEKITHLSRINGGILARYFQSRKISDKTRKNEATFWSKAWEYAKQNHLVFFDQNPWDAFIPEDCEQSFQARALTEEEIQILLSQSTEWFRFMVWVAYYTGERFTAILELATADVDFERHIIHFRTTKQSKRKRTRTRFVYMLPDLELFLRNFKPHGETWINPLLIERNRNSRTVNHSMGDLFERLRKKHEGLFVCATFHSFRHTFASMLSNAGVPLEQRMEILDHSTAAAHQGYTHEREEKALAHAKTLRGVFTKRAS